MPRGLKPAAQGSTVNRNERTGQCEHIAEHPTGIQSIGIITRRRSLKMLV